MEIRVHINNVFIVPSREKPQMKWLKWNECYDQFGHVNRIHPKDINGQSLPSRYYPLIAQEIVL